MKVGLFFYLSLREGRIAAHPFSSSLSNEDHTVGAVWSSVSESIQGGEIMQGPARYGPFRAEYERNKKKIMMTQDTCGICGKLVDKSLPGTDPKGPTIDHIIPIARGGHPADISNLQLAHRCCNVAKSDSLASDDSGPRSNRDLPWSLDWKNFQAEK